MKQQSNIRYLFLRRQRQRVGGPLLALVLALWGGLLSPAGGQTTNKWMDDEIVAALQRPNGGGITAFIRLFDRRSEHREQAIKSLLKLLNEARSDPSIKCCAAYYLGAMHA